jgi:hypothetical protein
VVDHPKDYLVPSQLDTRDPDFARHSSVWAAQTQCEITALVEATKEAIADSRALMVEADRIVASFRAPGV